MVFLEFLLNVQILLDLGQFYEIFQGVLFERALLGFVFLSDVFESRGRTFLRGNEFEQAHKSGHVAVHFFHNRKN